MEIKSFLSIIFMLVALFTNANATEANKAAKYVKTFKIKQWQVYENKQEQGLSCYAIATAFKTKGFEGIRNSPFIAYTYKGPQQYSLSVCAGFPLSKKHYVSLNISNRKYNLKNGASDTAWTYSKFQDVDIYSNLLKSNYVFKVRSYNNSQTALDYYSTDGLIEATSYMEKHCIK